jgi:hypothetical protein
VWTPQFAHFCWSRLNCLANSRPTRTFCTVEHVRRKEAIVVLSGTRISDTCLKASKQLKHKIQELSALERIKNTEMRNARFACQRYASSYEAMIQTGRDYIEMLL